MGLIIILIKIANYKLNHIKPQENFIFKYCPWYYKYKSLFFDHLIVNFSNIIKFKQPIYYNGWVINNYKIGRYD